MTDYRLGQTLAFTIHRTAVRLKTSFNRHLLPHGITADQFAILASLWESDGMLQSQLAERLFKDGANISRMVDRLEDKGLVRRERDQKDRRVSHVQLTPRGRKIQGELLDSVQSFREQAYKGLNGEELDRLREVLDRIVINNG